MSRSRSLEPDSEEAAREAAIESVISDEIEPLIHRVQAAAQAQNLSAMREHARVLVRTVNTLLDEGPPPPGRAA